MDHLLQRTKLLELQLGSEDSSIVEDIALIQAKLQQLYDTHPELYILNQLQQEIPDAARNDASSVSGDAVEDGRKQELIAIKYTKFSETLRNVAELQAMQFSEIPGAMCREFHVSRVIKRKGDLLRIARDYQTLAVKTLVVMQQYEEMIIRENRFWLTYQKRLDAANACLGAAERKRTEKTTY